MASWGDLERQRPAMAEGARSLLYQHGVGLAFLATVRPDGGPRLHPFCPVLNGDEMYGFILPSPKQEDLRRDGRYAVHSFPTPDNEDAFMVTGRAFIVPDAAVRSTLAARFVEERVAIGVPPPDDEDLLVRFDLERGLLTRTSGFGDFAPRHEIWAAQQ